MTYKLLQEQIASLVRQYGYVDVRKALTQYAEQVLDDARAAELKRALDAANAEADANPSELHRSSEFGSRYLDEKETCEDPNCWCKDTD